MAYGGGFCVCDISHTERFFSAKVARVLHYHKLISPCVRYLTHRIVGTGYIDRAIGNRKKGSDMVSRSYTHAAFAQIAVAPTPDQEMAEMVGVQRDIDQSYGVAEGNDYSLADNLPACGWRTPAAA